jgi:hypothetical protein
MLIASSIRGLGSFWRYSCAVQAVSNMTFSIKKRLFVLKRHTKTESFKTTQSDYNSYRFWLNKLPSKTNNNMNKNTRHKQNLDIIMPICFRDRKQWTLHTYTHTNNIVMRTDSNQQGLTKIHAELTLTHSLILLPFQTIMKYEYSYLYRQCNIIFQYCFLIVWATVDLKVIQEKIRIWGEKNNYRKCVAAI